MDDQVRELVSLGKEHFQRGDYSLAAGHLEQVVARGAAFADVHHMLGVIYHQLGEFESAQRSFQKALDINPNYVEAALNLAIVCNDLGQYGRAQQIYGDAVARACSTPRPTFRPGWPWGRRSTRAGSWTRPSLSGKKYCGWTPRTAPPGCTSSWPAPRPTGARDDRKGLRAPLHQRQVPGRRISPSRLGRAGHRALERPGHGPDRGHGLAQARQD